MAKQDDTKEARKRRADRLRTQIERIKSEKPASNDEDTTTKDKSTNHDSIVPKKRRKLYREFIHDKMKEREDHDGIVDLDKKPSNKLTTKFNQF